MLLLILEDESMEPWTIVGSIIGAIIASIVSWGSILLNHRHQLKMQRENHEREVKTKALIQTIKNIMESRFLFLELHNFSLREERDLFRQYRTPPELFIWATNQTLQAVCDFSIAEYEERDRLKAFRTTPSEHSIYILKAQCHKSFFDLAEAEAKVIDCLRREIEISFDKEEYIKIYKAHYREYAKIADWKFPFEEESDEQRQENR